MAVITKEKIANIRGNYSIGEKVSLMIYLGDKKRRMANGVIVGKYPDFLNVRHEPGGYLVSVMYKDLAIGKTKDVTAREAKAERGREDMTMEGVVK